MAAKALAPVEGGKLVEVLKLDFGKEEVGEIAQKKTGFRVDESAVLKL